MARRDEDRAAIVGAAIGLLSTGTLKGLTMAEIARASGVPRATLYTHFSGKGEVLAALVVSEQQRFMATIEAEDDPSASAQDRLVAAFVVTVRMLRTHVVLRRLIQQEPEVILPLIVNRDVMQLAQAWAQSRLAPGGPPATPDPLDAAEYTTRLLFSLMLFDGTHYDLDDQQQIEELARRWVLPVVFGP